MKSTSTGRNCTALNRKGQPCQCHAIAGSTFCHFHEPSRAAQLAAQRKRGGMARHGRNVGTTGAPSDQPVVLRTLADLTAFCEKVAGDLYTLENSINRARALVSLGGLALELVKTTELETRLAALETRLAAGGL